MSEGNDLQSEIDRLRQENENLKKKLGVPSEFPKPTAPENLFIPEINSSIDAKSPPEDKVQLFRSLFRGREDVYATLWENAYKGTKGYSPATVEPWDKKSKKYLPLTDQIINEHLLGNKTIGVYPLLKDNTCWFLACDFDKGGWSLDAMAFFNICRQQGLPAYFERSRSGNGGHVWIFFSSPVQATDARQLGMRLLRETMVVRAELDLGSYDRFFPNQDFMPRGGFGNLIALPLQKKRREQGHTLFINPENPDLKPWPDQWFFLSHVERVSPAQLEMLLQKIPPIVLGPGASRKVPAAIREKYPAPQQIRCSLGAQFSIEKSGIPPWMFSQIKHLASLANREFFKRQKLRKSTYGVSAFIRCYQEDMSHLHLPRGIQEEITEMLNAAGSELAIEDQRPTHKKLSFEFLGTLTPDQEEVIGKVLSHDLGVLVAPPGVGKTVMGCYAIFKRNLPTLILSHRKPILDQWRQQLVKLLGLPPTEIGQMGGGKDRSTGIVDLMMLQSLKRIEDLMELFSRYGFVVVDECHHIPALTFEKNLNQAPVRYILGLTATMERRDKLQGIINMQCGPVRQKMISQESDKILTLVNRDTAFIVPDSENAYIQDIFRFLVQNEERNEQIAKNVCDLLNKDRRCLILSQWKEHCDHLATKLIEKGKNPIVLVGTLGKNERASLLEKIQNSSPDQELLIIATGQYVGEGFDCPQIDTLFMAFPTSFKGQLIQYVGRVMRDYPDKTSVLVYDYVDSQVPVLKKMHARRLKTYKSLKFQWSDTEGMLLF